eukprot:12429196-Karenia_brevis.AAC.1
MAYSEFADSATVAYVDDAAFIVHIDTSDLLHDAAKYFYNLVSDATMSRGLQLNMKKGKTEIVPILYDSRAVEVKARLARDDGLIEVGRNTSIKIRTSRYYKHLGAMMMDDGGMSMEVKNRVQSHAAAVAPLTTTVFRRARLSLPRNAILLESYANNCLFYNAHVWGYMNKTAMKSLNTAYIRGYRAAGHMRYCNTKNQDMHVSDSEVLCRMKAAPIAVRISHARL